jgi:hypothetical protein
VLSEHDLLEVLEPSPDVGMTFRCLEGLRSKRSNLGQLFICATPGGRHGLCRSVHRLTVLVSRQVRTAAIGSDRATASIEDDL